MVEGQKPILGISIIAKRTLLKFFSYRNRNKEEILASAPAFSMSRERDYPHAEYSTIAGPRIKGALFVTNRQVNSVLHSLAEKHPDLLRGKPIGQITLTADKESRILFTRDYYPLGKDYVPEKLGNIGEALRRTGIATQIEATLLKRWVKRFPERKFSITLGASDARKAQVKKRGIGIEKPSPIKDFQDKTRKYLIKKASEARLKRHLK
ncbi:MAG: hypothetical protein Q7R70_02665 [Candidatus Diapherotrites archaeon]|nr:hypothetical protein [Candidatus Diapherotrites archaeon]